MFKATDTRKTTIQDFVRCITLNKGLSLAVAAPFLMSPKLTFRKFVGRINPAKPNMLDFWRSRVIFLVRAYES